MDTESVECPDCHRRFDMDQGAAATACPLCGHRFTVMRAENARVLVPEQVAGGDGTGCLLVLLILAALYALSVGRLP